VEAVLNQAQCARSRDIGLFAHRARGRLEDLRFVACATVGMTDLSISCAAHIEEIVASMSVESPTSAGNRSFRISAVVLRSEVDAKRSGSTSGDAEKRREGAVNLTPYGWGRL
jgi:hypothetical protein